jgi:lipopolysaccharide exporter
MSAPMSFTQHVRRGMGWTGLSLAVIVVMQLGYTAFTARLLAPDHFAFYACAQALAALVGYLSLGSLSAAVLRQPAERAVGLARLAFRLAAIAGGLGLSLLLLAADLWANTWNLPEATTVIRVMAIFVLIAPAHGVSLALVRRRLRFRYVAIVELLASASGFAVGSFVVYATQSAVGLVIGQITMLAMGLALTLLTAIRIGAVDGKSPTARDLIAFTGKVSAQNFSNYVVLHAPSLIISRALGAVALGVFSRAFLLVSLPVGMVSQAAAKTVYPIWGRVSDIPSLRGALTDALSITTLAGAAAFGALGGASSHVVALLLGERFVSAVPILQILSVYGFIYVPASIAASFQESASKFDQVRIVQTVKLIGLAPLILAFWIPSLTLCAATLILSQLLAHVVQLRQLARDGLVDGSRIAQAYSAHLLVGAVLCLTWLAPQWFLGAREAAIALSAGATATWLVAMTLMGRRIPGLVALSARGFNVMSHVRLFSKS